MMQRSHYVVLATCASITLLAFSLVMPPFVADLQTAHTQLSQPTTVFAQATDVAQTAQNAPSERILQPSPNGWTAVSIVDGQGQSSVFWYLDPEVGVRCYRFAYDGALGCVRIGAEPSIQRRPDALAT